VTRRRSHTGEQRYVVRGRAVGYCRVSTERQAGEGVSLDAQSAKIRAMVAVQDADLLELVTDAGASAKNLARPGLERVLALVDARTVDTVIVAKLDRLTRSVRDLADLLDRFARRGVALVSVAESLDTGTAAGRLVLNVMTSVAQWEREAISERTRDALRHKKALGLRVGEIPYGFALAADRRRLEEDAGEQATLARMRALRAEGRSFQAVADELNRLGSTTRRGTSWRYQYVADLARRSGVAVEVDCRADASSGGSMREVNQNISERGGHE
jgi:site-specific DNA recombinase